MKPTWGLGQEALVKFFGEVIEGVSLMSQRQRWVFRRDIKTFCKLANVRWPYGKGYQEELSVSNESGRRDRVLSTVRGEERSDGAGTVSGDGRDAKGKASVADRTGNLTQISKGQENSNGEEAGC